MVKTCFKCGIEKPVEDFYRHPRMTDGHLGKCKTCTCRDMRIARVMNPRVREYDRQRSKLPHRVALRSRIVMAWQANHPDRYKAHVKSGNAVRDGKLQRPECCEGCGLPKRVEKHHSDYSKPLLVVWLCKPCHIIADKIRRKLESA